ncbi:tryptophan synthase subunit beta [Rhodococcus erythropolis]|uniref:tryptophan synthase subunit beta n=1 Tax=Rhodococcus erythropolis TaxID=1833 RepID=UPI0009B94450|nr:tryptophan synthase subunit beta [Rhodococcus erythropolis]
MADPGPSGRFGRFGGRYVPEALVPACLDLEKGYREARRDPEFQMELSSLLAEYCGRPTPVSYARRLSRELGITLLLKREDLNHTGSHKINNALGQAILARRMGKTALLAETGAGQHGVATATAAALLGMKCTIYMGAIDTARQELNVHRMETLGAEVISVETGAKTLKDATSEAFRHWVAHTEDTHYCLGSVLGPHPYPWIVRELQSVIGIEAAAQCAQLLNGAIPDVVVACVGGGSNAAGTFAGFVSTDAQLIGVESAGGDGATSGRLGVFHGSMSKYLQDPDGQILEAHSIAAGLDYPGIGPEHAHLADLGRAKYVTTTDAQVVEAARLLARFEGIFPALESAHAIAWVVEAARTNRFEPDITVLVTVSGRGDKDAEQIRSLEHE